MVEYLSKYWLELALVVGVAVILLPTIFGAVYGRFWGEDDDRCLSDIDKVLDLQSEYPECSDELDLVAMVILKRHREH